MANGRAGNPGGKGGKGGTYKPPDSVRPDRDQGRGRPGTRPVVLPDRGPLNGRPLVIPPDLHGLLGGLYGPQGGSIANRTPADHGAAIFHGGLAIR